MEFAYRWWNGIVNEEPESSAKPCILTPEDTALILLDVSPILHNHTDFTLPQDEYWMQASDIIEKLTEEKPPNPNEDFPAFVEFLYKNRNTIKLSNVESCMNYIDKFCPDPPGSFFLTDLVFSVSNPELCVQTLQNLIKIKDKRWLQCIEQQGFVDRVFDLFISFIVAFDTKTDENLNFRIDVADFLVNILEYRRGTLEESMYLALYIKTLTMMERVQNPLGYSFFRCAIRINQRTLRTITKDQKHERMKMLLNVAHSAKYYSKPIYKYLLTMTNYIDILEIAKGATRFLPKTPMDLDILIDIADANQEHNQEVYLVIVKALCRTIMQNKIFNRYAAQLLAEILNDNATEEVMDWMKAFVRRVFIFMKFSILRNKYLHKTLLLCSILSSSLILSISWLKPSILAIASDCYRQHMSFLSDYFDIVPESDDLFNKEVSIFDQMKVNLKYFPFKAGCSSMIENHQTREYMVKQVKKIDERLTNLNIDPNISKYLYYDPEITNADQKQAEFQIEDMEEEQRGILAECEKNHNKINYPKSYKFVSDKQMLIKAASMAYKEAENAVWDFQRHAIDDVLQQLKEVFNAVHNNPNVMPNLKQLITNHNASVTESARYKLLKQRRHSAKKFTFGLVIKYAAPDYSLMIAGEMTSAMFKYDQSLFYVPPTKIDTYVKEYLYRTHYKEMLEAAGSVFAEGTIDAAESTLKVLTDSVNEQFDRQTEQTFILIYYAIMRHVFDIAYGFNSILNKYKESNIEFLIRCEAYAKKPIRETSLPDAIIGNMRKKASVATLFRTKKIGTFQNLEFILNPVDMYYNIHQIVQSIDTLVPEVTFNDEEKQNIVIALIAINPPSNIVSIIKFCLKWINFVKSSEMQVSFFIFKDAADRILMTDSIHQDL